MFAEQFARVLEGTRSLAQLDSLSRDLWKASASGALTDGEAQAFAERIHAQRGEARAARTPVGIPVGRVSIFRARRYQASPDRAASIRRRRKIAASGPLPPALAALFTISELSVLGIVTDEVRVKGVCGLSLGEISARAGVCRATAQNALRLAAAEGLLAIQERRRQGKVNLTNLVRVVSAEWVAWIARARRSNGIGSKKLDLTDTSELKPVKTGPAHRFKGLSGEGRRGDRARPT